MNLIEMMQDFPDNESCVRHLEKVRWGNTPLCPYCGSHRSSRRVDGNRHVCHGCNRSYSVLVGTVFQSSNLPLRKWFIAICLMANAKKGISSLQLARDIGVNKNTAWYVQKRIRQAMEEHDLVLSGLVEADETYVGGLRSNMSQVMKDEKGLRGTGMEGKTPVLGMIEREGRIIVKVIGKAWGKEIKPLMKRVIDPSSRVVTDGFGAYYGLEDHFQEHAVLNHTRKVMRKGEYHTNTIEGFWSMFKRAIIGQFHRISGLHLQEYLNELSFKYNYRNENIFEILMKRCLTTAHATS